MLVSRSPFRPGHSLVISLCLGLLAGQPAFAQQPVNSAPSPVAPGDLTKPVFDTTTPVYDQIESLEKAASTVVAEVEGRPITLGNVNDAIVALPLSMKQMSFDALYPSVLDHLIKQQAMVVRAQQQGVDEDPKIRRKVREAADAALADEYLAKVITPAITEAALLDRYNRDYAGKPGEEEVRTRIIMTATEKEALDLIAEIRGGADFATVARRSSKDASASAGGDVGFAPREGLTPEVGAVAFSLPPGQMAPYPVRSVDAWFIVKTEQRRLQPTPSFAAMRARLFQILLHEGVPAAAETALNNLKVRRYGLNGKENDADKANAQ